MTAVHFWESATSRRTSNPSPIPASPLAHGVGRNHLIRVSAVRLTVGEYTVPRRGPGREWGDKSLPKPRREGRIGTERETQSELRELASR